MYLQLRAEKNTRSQLRSATTTVQWEIPPSTPSLAKPSLTCFLLPLLALRPPPADDARFDPENFMHLMSARTLVSQHASSLCKSPDGAPFTVLGQRTISLESQDVEKWKRRAASRVQIGVGSTVHCCRTYGARRPDDVIMNTYRAKLFTPRRSHC